MAAVSRPPLRVWIWAAVTVVLVVVAVLLWRNSQAAATDHTEAAPAAAPTGTPAGALSQRWSATGNPLPDDVVIGARVIVGSPHGFRALDASTGREAWRYERSNARLCGVTATDGVVVGVFRTANRCDEAVALRADTGVYAWTRNLNLRPDATLTSAPRIVLASSPTGVLTLDPTGDNIRWDYHAPKGCRLLDTAVGSSDVAIVQRCPGAAAQLRVLDGFGGKVRWSRDLVLPDGATARLGGVDRVVSIELADGIHLLAETDGHDLGLLPVTEPLGPVQQLVVGETALIWQGGTLAAVDAGSGAQLWQQSAGGLPAPGGSTVPGPLLVPENGAFVQRDARTGQEVGRSTAPDIPMGGTTSRVGPVVVYQVGDRVIGYR